jgi:hypothetical protein
VSRGQELFTIIILQVYKSTADFESASAMYAHYSHVDEHMLRVRELVLAAQTPRPLLVQPVTRIFGCGIEKEAGVDDEAKGFDREKRVELLQFSASPAGIVESFVARFPVGLLLLYQVISIPSVYSLGEPAVCCQQCVDAELAALSAKNRFLFSE